MGEGGQGAGSRENRRQERKGREGGVQRWRDAIAHEAKPNRLLIRGP